MRVRADAGDAPAAPRRHGRPPGVVALDVAGAPFGVYVHVPFCSRRCDYCAFATWTDRAPLMPAYAAACRAELAGVDRPATSVFFGGGTPSLLPAELLCSILGAVRRAPGCEVTVECNPETVTPALLASYREAGVTRLSFGVQSMVPHVLAGLGRAHAVEAAERAASLAVALGFDSWNVDVIFGGAGERDRDWHTTLTAVVALGAPHVSAYALTVEPGTPLARDRARHPSDDVLATRYLMAEEVLAAAGLQNYEISNWARPGHACRHNLLYWAQGDYAGIGCAAHSHVDGRRWWNIRDLGRYLARVEAGRSPVAGEELLDPAVRRRERLELALRTASGVPGAALTPADQDLLSARGLIRRGGDGIVLTPEGRLLANEVALRLVA